MSVMEVDFDAGLLMPISVETLRASKAIPFDLYLPGNQSERPGALSATQPPHGRCRFRAVDATGCEDALHRALRFERVSRVPSRHDPAKNDDISARCTATRSSARPRCAVLARSVEQGRRRVGREGHGRAERGQWSGTLATCRSPNDVLRVMSHDYSVFAPRHERGHELPPVGQGVRHCGEAGIACESAREACCTTSACKMRRGTSWTSRAS